MSVATTKICYIAQISAFMLLTHMGARSIFSRGGQIRGLETKVPLQGPRIEPLWGSLWRAKPPEADDRL